MDVCNIKGHSSLKCRENRASRMLFFSHRDIQCGKYSLLPTCLQELARGHHRYITVNLRLKYVWFSGYPTDTPYPPLPFKHFKGFSSAICPSRVRHGGHFCHSKSMCVLCSWTQLGPEHEINLRGDELVKTLLVLMTDVISKGSGEHVCLRNLVLVSLTNSFKWMKTLAQIKILDIYVRCLKIIVSGFLSTCNNGYSYQSKTSNSSKWNILTNCRADRGVSVCPHETAHRRSYKCITSIMYAQTHIIHVPRNKLIVARFCILIILIITYLIPWNKPAMRAAKAQTSLRIRGKSPAP